jgi:predicted nuclease of predicted toxin-antitoxin system
VKLLLDQNISYRLVKKLQGRFPGTQHVNRLGLGNKPDKIIILVTFDADFYDFSLTFGYPPKLVLVKSKNLSTRNLEYLLLDKSDQIEDFYHSDDLSCIELID